MRIFDSGRQEKVTINDVAIQKGQGNGLWGCKRTKFRKIKK